MNLLIPFIILIERRRLPRAIVAAVTSVAMLFSGFGSTVAHAAPAGGQSQDKIARDLDDEVAQTGAPKARWARDVNGVRHVQAIVVSNSTDSEMTDLRTLVKALGGSVHAVHPWMRALTVQIPANQLQALS